MFVLSKVDPKFRLFVDKLFFTDQINLDIENLNPYLNYPSNKEYLIDRLDKSFQISWDESFWINRFEFILSFDNKNINSFIEETLFSRFKSIVLISGEFQLQNVNIQLIAWAKAKSNKKENIITIKNFLIDLSKTIKAYLFLKILNEFIPTIFKSVDEYNECISKCIHKSSRAFHIMKDFEDNGVILNNKYLIESVKNTFFRNKINNTNKCYFFNTIRCPLILEAIKKEYNPSYKPRLINFIKLCSSKDLDNFHYENMKNIIAIDESISDELIILYADKLSNIGYGRKKTNIGKIMRACKTFPHISTKKVLAYLSSNGRANDIKYWISNFPELKKLAIFA